MVLPFASTCCYTCSFTYAVRLPNVGFGKQLALVAEPDRPVSCCMAVLTMRLGGGRSSMSDGFSLYVIIVLEISGPWLSGI